MSSFKPKLLASTIAMALLPGLLQAQILDEITVTAQKREQSVQDVGIAMSAFSGEQMEQLGFANAQQVTAMAPGVSTIQPNGEANYAIAIRGVASSDFTTNVESPVALYLDEVYISQMSGAGFQSSASAGKSATAASMALYNVSNRSCMSLNSWCMFFSRSCQLLVASCQLIVVLR